MVNSVLGVDIGGSGMKAALVDPSTGVCTSERFRIPTPQPATPSAMGEVFAALVDHFDHDGLVGATFPGVVDGAGRIRTAVNLDASWVGTDATNLFRTDGSPVVLLNDGDAAGLAEMRFGAGRRVAGTVVMITIGTGLGTAVFTDGHLVANTELGHIEIDGVDAETKAAGRVIKRDGLSVEQWAPNFARYLRTLEDLLWPSLFILGGGISKRFDEWSGLIEARTPLVPAMLRNHAGIVGAALAAAESSRD